MCNAIGCECRNTDCVYYNYVCGWCDRWAPLKFDDNGKLIFPSGLVKRLARGDNFCKANDIK